ncbi:hypothetical protein [Frigidibacter oleivorans]|uniref:hypothetical protein n=1 Tax=Frigidibacter oleivorans TaxID=2487129 RepID=UPI000F8F4604|nr:hypothetical protein [Frigidibacter oleivorans]
MTTLTLDHAPRRSPLAAIGEIFRIFEAAVSASADIQAHRRPDDATLRALGIEPAAFPALH